MSGRGKSKSKIHISKPEPPPFLQRMREQIVANEDADRIERSIKKRKDRPERSVDSDDDPTIVRLEDTDITEEEFKRMKKELETQYKLDSDITNYKHEELNVDLLIQVRSQEKKDLKSKSVSTGASRRGADSDVREINKDRADYTPTQSSSKITKTLSYDSSSDDDG